MSADEEDGWISDGVRIGQIDEKTKQAPTLSRQLGVVGSRLIEAIVR